MMVQISRYFSFDGIPDSVSSGIKFKEKYFGARPTMTKCSFCGSLEFNVAFGSYQTWIRCKNCLKESMVHEG